MKAKQTTETVETKAKKNKLSDFDLKQISKKENSINNKTIYK